MILDRFHLIRRVFHEVSSKIPKNNGKGHKTASEVRYVIGEFVKFFTILAIFESFETSRSVRFTKTIEPGDKTAVCFTWVFNNDVINKNTAV